MKTNFHLLFVIFVVLGLSAISICNGGKFKEGLRTNFYRRTCSQAEQIVKNITWSHVHANPTMAAKLLRLHYHEVHDCFVRGCDASILLDSIDENNKAEKEARPNLSLSGYEVIDEIKTKIEEICPGTVSCADIVALAARDAVSFQFGRSMWKVLTGRRDGIVSFASEVTPNSLPSASANFTTLQQIFSSKGLNVIDLVALSGAHTIGIAHCGVISRRLSNFTGKGDTDPSLDPTYANFLKSKCSNPPPANIVEMDPQNSGTFNSHYFKILNQRKGLFNSDAALLTDPVSANIVKLFEQPRVFIDWFARGMMKMGDIEVLTERKGEIRKQCRIVNSRK